MRNLVFIPTLFILLINYSAHAQLVDPYLVSSCGTSISNGSYILDYSIGEIVTTTIGGPSFINTQGFHQPDYDNSTSVNEIKNSKWELYPNPTSGLLTIKQREYSERFKIDLYNSIGEKIKTIESCLLIDLTLFPSGLYVVLLQSESEGTQAYFSVIKF